MLDERHSGEGSEEIQDNNANSLNNNGNDQSQQGQQQHPDRFHRNQGTILFVGNLPFQTPWQHVKDHFRQAGNVRYTDLIADRTGRPKGSALVTMMNLEGAENAIRMFNETDFEGRRLIVRKFDDGPRPPLVQREMMPAYTSAGVGAAGGMRRGVYGNVMGGGMANGGYYRGGVGGAPMGQGYGRGGSPMGQPYGAGGVSPYQGGGDLAAAAAAAGDLDGDSVPKPRSQQVPEAGRKLFVSNLPFDCTSGALRETFQQVGAVERAEIILGRSGKSRGMGIVVMKSEDEARVAIAEFDGIEMAGRAMNVRLDNRTQ